MREYQSIPYYRDRFNGQYVYAFNKLDGSNIRVEYSKKKGFYKFGSRTKLIDETSTQFGQAVHLFYINFKDKLLYIINNNKRLAKAKEIVFFFEYYGDNSFAGMHDPNDEMKLVLIDVWEHTLIKPKDFIDWFSSVNIPTLIYEGILDHDFCDDIRKNKYNLMEGVVLKTDKHMFKLKTDEWLTKVKVKYGDVRYNEELK